MAYTPGVYHNQDGNISFSGFNFNYLLTVASFSLSSFKYLQSNPYALKESGPTSDMTAWTSAGLQPTTGYYPYDPALAAYG